MFALVCLAIVTCFSNRALGVEIEGTVRSATAKYATVTSNSQFIPVPGDKVDIFFKMPGTNYEISIGNGRVYEITGNNIMVQVQKATGKVAKDQLVRIHSPNSKKREDKAAQAKPTVTPSVTASSSPPTTSAVAKTAATQAPHMPGPTSATGHEIWVAVRNYIMGKYVKEPLAQPITFKVNHILVTDRFGNMEAVPVFQDGSNAIPKYLPDIAYNFCLEKTNLGWIVIADLSRSDVPDQAQITKIRASLPPDFALDVLTPTWRKLLGGSTN